MGDVLPRRIGTVVRVVIPMWIVPLVAWVPPPFPSLLIPKTLTTFPLLGWAASRPHLACIAYRCHVEALRLRYREIASMSP